MNDFPRHISDLPAIIDAATDEAQSSAYDGRQQPVVVFIVKAVDEGSGVDFKFQPVITNAGVDDIDFTAASDPETNPYSVCSVVDKDGEIQSAPVLISAEGTYIFELNWNLAGTYGVQLLDGAGPFTGTVTVDVQQSTRN